MLFGQRFCPTFFGVIAGSGWVPPILLIYVLPYSFCIRLGMIAISLSVIKRHCLPDYLYKSSGSAFLSGDRLYYPFAWTHLQSCVPRGIRRPASADGLDILFRVLSIFFVYSTTAWSNSHVGPSGDAFRCVCQLVNSITW